MMLMFHDTESSTIRLHVSVIEKMWIKFNDIIKMVRLTLLDFRQIL